MASAAYFNQQMPAYHHVLVASSPEAAAHARWLINEAASFSPTGSVRVVDLRAHQ